MSTFSATGSGSVSVFGCSDFRVGQNYPYKYPAGSIVYVKKLAAKGKLQAISIRRVIFHKDKSTFNSPLFTYVDSTNDVWLENELIPQSQAITLAKQYLARLQQQLLDNMRNCENYKSRSCSSA